MRYTSRQPLPSPLCGTVYSSQRQIQINTVLCKQSFETSDIVSPGDETLMKTVRITISLSTAEQYVTFWMHSTTLQPRPM